MFPLFLLSLSLLLERMRFILYLKKITNKIILYIRHKVITSYYSMLYTVYSVQCTMYCTLYCTVYRLTGSDLHSEVMIRHHIFFFAKCFCSFVLTFFIFKFFSLHTYSTYCTYILWRKKWTDRKEVTDWLFTFKNCIFDPKKGMSKRILTFGPSDRKF